MPGLWRSLEQVPEGFELLGNVTKIMDNRRKMAAGALPIDWGFAETMAYASLVSEGYGVRLSGQDSARGTFFHRHAVLHNQKDGELYVPLRNVSPDQGNFLVINSLLSEEAVLAFEYGYATTDPRTLVIWEAQFGDFANNAQVVIDQFISAGEQKWNRLCGLVMFLPHGMEGQGPEHSSARLERYLQLCAEQNMQVCVPTTPAQIFHLLRRQTLLECRKPLVVMTPKSLLRHRLAISSLEDLSSGEFQPLIDEVDELDAGELRVQIGQQLASIHVLTLLDVHGAGAQRSDPKTGDPSAFPTGHGPQGDAVRIDNHVRLRDISRPPDDTAGKPGSAEPPGWTPGGQAPARRGGWPWR